MGTENQNPDIEVVEVQQGVGTAVEESQHRSPIKPLKISTSQITPLRERHQRSSHKTSSDHHHHKSTSSHKKHKKKKKKRRYASDSDEGDSDSDFVG